MVSVPTVFILGAGASAPFGFPIGSGLTRDIVQNLRKEKHGYQALHEQLNYSPEQIESFRTALFHSGWPSVDSFLEHREDLMPIGKAAMAQELIRYENEGKLFAYSDTDGASNWLREMYVRLKTSSVEAFAKHRLSFITFNYDRSVEHFLFSALHHGYGEREERCAEVLRQIPVIHLHGRLGFLPWQDEDDHPKNERPYAIDVNLQTLQVGRTLEWNRQGPPGLLCRTAAG
jgi:hypothetical protein